MHIWLDPQNAKAIVATVAATLSEADPANAARYEANAAAMKQKLDALTTELDELLAPVKGKPFIVFHDAYQYMEKRFDLSAAGSITVTPEVQPGAARLTELQEKIRTLGATCVFSEPQFEPRLVNIVIEGTPARSGVLDPLGAELDAGPEMYFDLMRQNALALVDCLTAQG